MEYSKTLVERIFDRAVAYRRELLLSAALITAGAGGVSGYFFYKNVVARQAHKAYAKALELQQARVLKAGEMPGVFETTFNNSEEKWTAVGKAFGQVYADYGHVGVGVMAGAAQAQALVRLNKKEEARTVLGDVTGRIPSPELRALHTLTYARLLLDSEQEADRQKGLALLAQLAATADSVVHDSALYYLGLHHWHNHETSSAANYWRQLIALYDSFDRKGSPWVSKAKEYLTLIGEQGEEN